MQFLAKKTLPLMAAAALPVIAAAQDTARDYRIPGTLGQGVETTAEAVVFGAKVALVGMLAVFIGLMAIFIALKVLHRISKAKVKPRADGADQGGEPPPELTAEIVHAIALALYLDLRTFGEEAPEDVTIRKVTRPFSGWWNSGKTHMMVDKWTFPARRG